VKKLIRINENLKKEFTIEEILEMYEPLIIKYADRFIFANSNEFITLDDVKQELSIKLCESFKKYDVSTDVGFGYYARVMLELELKYLYRKINRNSAKIIKSCISLDEKFGRDKDLSLYEVIEDKIDYIEDFICEESFKIVLNKLNDREKDIIKSSVINGVSQISLAKKYNISQAQVSRIINKSLKKLKEAI
jgi:RNA polymerase sigma factor (sigma-70 family)